MGEYDLVSQKSKSKTGKLDQTESNPDHNPRIDPGEQG